MKDCFAYSFANNGGHYSPSLGLDTCRVDPCSSSFGMIWAWKESIFQLNVQASTLSEDYYTSIVMCIFKLYDMNCTHVQFVKYIDGYWL